MSWSAEMRPLAAVSFLRRNTLRQYLREPSGAHHPGDRGYTMATQARTAAGLSSVCMPTTGYVRRPRTVAREKWLLALLGGFLGTPFVCPFPAGAVRTQHVRLLGHVANSPPLFHPSVPVPTTVQIPLPEAKKDSLLFEFHPSANPTAVRVVASSRDMSARACASAGLDGTGAWSNYWHGCISIPAKGASLPADNGLMHVGVVVNITSPARLKRARLLITYLPGDYHFSEVALTPRSSVGSIAMTTASKVVLGAGVDSKCGGRFTVVVDNRAIVKRSVEPGSGTWVNELPVKGSTFRFSLTHLRCRGSGENVGLGVDTGSPGGP
jgi:hypothetical protein